MIYWNSLLLHFISHFSSFMSYHFSVIFFINDIIDDQIICSFADDNLDNIRSLIMLFWQNMKTDLSVQAAYQFMKVGNFYFIAETLTIIDENYLTFIVSSKGWATLEPTLGKQDVDHVSSSSSPLLCLGEN